MKLHGSFLRNALISVLLLVISAFGATNTSTKITGTFVDPANNPLDGYLSLQLPFAGAITQEGKMVPPINIRYAIRQGVLQPSVARLINNADIIPGNTYYLAKVYDFTNILMSSFYVQIPDVSVFDIGSAAQSTFTSGNISLFDIAASGTFTSAGVFTSTQMNEYIRSIIGPCITSTESNRFFGTNSTIAITGCIDLPAGATVGQAAALAGFATTHSSGPPAYGVWGQSTCTVADSKCSGGIFVGGDVAGLGATNDVEVFGANVQVRQKNAAATYQIMQGVPITGVFDFAPPSFATAVNFTGVGFPWPALLTSTAGQATNFAAIGAQCTVGTCPSQVITLTTTIGGVQSGTTSINLDNTANLTITPPSGGAVRPCGAPRHFATLAACGAATEGSCAAVDNSSVNAWGGNADGAGALHVKVQCDGINWTVEGK